MTWWEPADGDAAIVRAQTAEQHIRADARAEVHWLHDKPWRAGKQLSALIRYWRQRHTESVGRTHSMKRAGLLICIGALTLASCRNDADVASDNLSTAADNFEITRRIVFYNGITGDYILEVEGLCSLGNNDTNKRMSVTCKVGPNSYKKHFLGLSDNVTFFAEQIDPAPASIYRYRVVFKPSVIIPDIDAR